MEVLETDAVSCTVPSEATVVTDGETVTTGVSAVTVTVACPDTVGAETLVAVIVALVFAVTVGASYNPVLLMVPTEAVQVTTLLEALLTTAENCLLPGDATVVVAGETVTTTAPGAETVICKAVVLWPPTGSLTVILKLDVPATVGVPEIVPLVELRAKPAGNAPVSAKW